VAPALLPARLQQKISNAVPQAAANIFRSFVRILPAGRKTHASVFLQGLLLQEPFLQELLSQETSVAGVIFRAGLPQQP
jgi:hypothetical protein